MSIAPTAVYVLGTEGGGKSDLIHQLLRLCAGEIDTRPAKLPPTTGQSIHKIALGAGAGVELRELGGSMLPTWESFLKARVEREAAAQEGGGGTLFRLVFVVDVAAPHQLAAARYAFQWLKTSAGGVCRAWPTAVVLQKCAAPGAVTVPEVAALLGLRSVADAELFEVDSWNGLGHGDVLDWLTRHSK